MCSQVHNVLQTTVVPSASPAFETPQIKESPSILLFYGLTPWWFHSRGIVWNIPSCIAVNGIQQTLYLKRFRDNIVLSVLAS